MKSQPTNAVDTYRLILAGGDELDEVYESQATTIQDAVIQLLQMLADHGLEIPGRVFSAMAEIIEGETEVEDFDFSSPEENFTLTLK